MLNKRQRPPIHPGEILKEEFMVCYNLSANALARLLSVPSNRIVEIVNGKRGITVDTALRLARCFGNSAEFWLNLQKHFELAMAEYENLPSKIKQEVRIFKSA